MAAESELKSIDTYLLHLETGDRTELFENGELSRELENQKPLMFMPRNTDSNSGEPFDDIRRVMPRYFGIEALFFLERPREEIQDVHDEERLLALYNLSRGVSTLKGADYYSASRGYRRTLFHQFYRIDAPGSRTPLADPLVTAIPDKDSFRVFQEDSTFGEDEYEICYTYEKPVIDLTMKNLTYLNYSILPIAGKEKLFMTVRIIPVREGYLFYGACLVEGRKIRVPGKNINDSLTNRVKALIEWFGRRIESELP